MTDTYHDPALVLMGIEFQECAECAAKPGAPTLCGACIHNRRVINALVAALTQCVATTRIEVEHVAKLAGMSHLEPRQRPVAVPVGVATDGSLVMSDDLSRLMCPVCRHDNGTDLDGLGCMHCTRCGWCNHRSLTGDVCDVCEVDVRCRCSRDCVNGRVMWPLAPLNPECPLHGEHLRLVTPDS